MVRDKTRHCRSRHHSHRRKRRRNAIVLQQNPTVAPFEFFKFKKIPEPSEVIGQFFRFCVLIGLHRKKLKDSNCTPGVHDWLVTSDTHSWLVNIFKKEKPPGGCLRFTFWCFFFLNLSALFATWPRKSLCVGECLMYVTIDVYVRICTQFQYRCFFRPFLCVFCM